MLENGLGRALIGYTGFVGSNLIKQVQFDHLYNRQNIETIGNKIFDVTVCAAPSAEKWRANRDPESDLQMVNELIHNLAKVKTHCFIQISTIDVYAHPLDVNEDSPIELKDLHPYGRNRFLIEEFVRNNFDNYLVVRLPALFGQGLKKNFIFDLINNNTLEMTDSDTEFQFYFINHLWDDISNALRHAVRTLNITSEPVSANELAIRCFRVNFRNKTEKAALKYNMKSHYAQIYGGKGGYMYDKNTILKEISFFLEHKGKE
jgi:nucleoside-diphosphate-sugar epimerase